MASESAKIRDALAVLRIAEAGVKNDQRVADEGGRKADLIRACKSLGAPCSGGGHSWNVTELIDSLRKRLDKAGEDAANDAADRLRRKGRISPSTVDPPTDNATE